MAQATLEATTLLRRAVQSDRVHGAYLLSGDLMAAHAAAVDFARALVCQGQDDPPCGNCHGCLLSDPDRIEEEPVVIRGTEKRGPFFRHIGRHPDLRWAERGPKDARVTIGQIRAIQGKLRLGAAEGGRQAVVIADAESMQAPPQNALLRILEEPPPLTTLILIVPSPVQLVATIRSRCVRFHFPSQLRPAVRGDQAEPDARALTEQLDRLPARGKLPVLEWAEEFRGDRATAAEKVEVLLTTGSEWLRERTLDAARAGQHNLQHALEAFGTLQRCRSDLVRHNANPQMVAERALMALQSSIDPN